MSEGHMQFVPRYLGAVIAGVMVSFMLVAVIEGISTLVYPVPKGVNLTDPEVLRSYIQSMPVGALLFVLAAWGMGTFVGSLMACGIAQDRPRLFASIVGGVVLAATVANLMAIPHPVWFSVTAVVLVPGSAFLASRWAPVKK